MKLIKSLLFLLAILAFGAASGQNFTQTIRGTIVDKISQAPLPGATVIILHSDPLLGTTTDLNGEFKLMEVPIGNHSLKISYLGYKEVIINSLTINSGKEMVLNISLEEDFKMMEEVNIKAEKRKNQPLNEMAAVSARSFSVEETQKYAAAVNDPARMVTAYAGVVQTDDGNNGISIRGNAPNGLIWRMEGVDIPNPNHFSNSASSGGGVSIISSQLLSNSDFMTGAFPAEYGNALSGVFDLKLRKGNNEKKEFTFQAGVLGIDVAAEGPFSPDYNGSYLINYRYSTLSLLGLLGVETFAGTTDFQDLSFNFNLPAGKIGNFSLFGFGGLSSQKETAEKDSTIWEFEGERYNSKFFSNTGAAGLKHTIVVDQKTFLQTSLVASANESGFEEERLDDAYIPALEYWEKFTNTKLSANSVLSYKLNSRIHTRTGFYLTKMNYDVGEKEFFDNNIDFEEKINAKGSTSTLQLFSQWSIKATEKLTFHAGLHYLSLAVNSSNSVEPRFSVKYEIDKIKTISLGYGLHSQIQPLGNYFFTIQQTDGTIMQPNKDLDFTKSHHFVLSYSQALNEHLFTKIETYYQHLFDIPVSLDPNSTGALINQEWGFMTEPLQNSGLGRNMGIEFTLEQYTNRGLYFMLSSSIYDSKYQASNGNWYNTRFNGNYAFSLTGGKEFSSNNREKPRVYGIHIKSAYNGGFRTTPIDLEKSKFAGEGVYLEDKAFEEKLPDYFRMDIRFSLKRQKEKSTHTFSLDIQNVTNRQNIFNRFYDHESQSLKTYYQTGLIPVFSYRIEF